jgi:signal transduction histidine kinase
VGARLHRRLFLWFGVSILVTGLTVGAVVNLVGGSAWQRESERVRTFVAHRFAETWDAPAERRSLAEGMARDLALDVAVLDARGNVLERAGEPCARAEWALPVERAGERLGEVRLCAWRQRHRPPVRLLLALALTGAMLWLASGKIARRLARPLRELARAARELGAGRLDTRARVHHRGHRAIDEVAEVALAFNDMAARIERQVSDQRELLAAVSHELRTPLGRLRVLTELLRDRGGHAPTLEQVEREVLEVDALVGELLASSRLDFGQLSPRPLEARELAARALERAGLAPDALAVETPDGALVGDPTLLGRALANLLENARRHAGGAEVLRVLEHDGQLAFCVDDRGPGLPPGEEQRIFEPFYRHDAGDAHEPGSLGLGLALVQRIARAHGGRTFAHNRPGGGARVGFSVERQGGAATAAQTRASSTSAAKRPVR